MSICIVLDSGLGNQLFMLFTGISKAIDEKKDFTIFPIYNTYRKFFFTNFLKSLVFKVNTNPSYNNDEIYQEPNFHYEPIPNNKKLIKGYFQSPKYFNHNKHEIIRILKIDTYLNKYKLDYKAIAVHLRFGDTSFNQCNHVFLKVDYYINAIKQIIEKLEQQQDNYNNYKFLIFGEAEDNDIIDDYINDFNIAFNYKIIFTKFYETYPNLTNYQELCYMSSCDHFIIANSTFSWFAAYLNDNKNKIVICPEYWFGPKLFHNNIKDLYCDNWIKVGY